MAELDLLWKSDAPTATIGELANKTKLLSKLLITLKWDKKTCPSLRFHIWKKKRKEREKSFITLIKNEAVTATNAVKQKEDSMVCFFFLFFAMHFICN